jgi:hypothetical protein
MKVLVLSILLKQIKSTLFLKHGFWSDGDYDRMNLIDPE